MMSAPAPSRLAAHDFARAGLLLFVSQVRISSCAPPTPPALLIWATRMFAAASAGPSNGAMLPLLSNAQPMVIADGLALAFRAPPATSAAATSTRTAPAAANRFALIPLLLP